MRLQTSWRLNGEAIWRKTLKRRSREISLAAEPPRPKISTRA
jgi:hypothetical protein